MSARARHRHPDERMRRSLPAKPGTRRSPRRPALASMTRMTSIDTAADRTAAEDAEQVAERSSAEQLTAARDRRGVSVESRALLVAIASVLLSAAVAALLFRETRVPLSGGLTAGFLEQGISVGVTAAASVAVLGTPAFLSTYLGAKRAPRPRRLAHRIRSAIDLAALVLVHVGIAALGLLGCFAVLQDAFLRLALGSYTAAGIVGLVTGLATYFIALSGARISTTTLASLLGLFLIAGALSAMLTANDPLWWDKNLSALGVGITASAIIFNATLVVAGLVVVGIADRVALDLAGWRRDARRPGSRRTTSRRVRLLQVGILLIGLLLAMVGLVTVNANMLVHNAAASGLGLVFVVVACALPMLLPGLPRAFLLLNYLMVLGVLGSTVLFLQVGYYNFTGYELVATGLVLVWLIVFVRNIAAVRADDRAAVR